MTSCVDCQYFSTAKWVYKPSNRCCLYSRKPLPRRHFRVQFLTSCYISPTEKCQHWFNVVPASTIELISATEASVKLSDAVSPDCIRLYKPTLTQFAIHSVHESESWRQNETSATKRFYEIWDHNGGEDLKYQSRCFGFERHTDW